MPEEHVTSAATIPMSRPLMGGSALVGVVIGTLVSLDAFVTPYLLPRKLQVFPWSFSMLLGSFVGLGSLGYWMLREFWAERYTLFLLMFIVLLQITGLDKLGSPNPLNLFLFVVVPILLFEILTTEEFAFRSSPLFFLAWGLFLFISLSLLNTSLLKGLQGLFSFCLRVGLLVTVVHLFRQRSQVRYVVEGMIWAGLCSGLIGVCQFVVWLTSDRVMTLVDVEDIVAPTPWGAIMRVPALFNTPNTFGEFMAVSLILALVLALSPSLQRWKRGLFLVGMVPMLASLLLSFSRGSWLAFAIVLVMLPCVLRPAWLIQIFLSYCSIGIVLWITGAVNWLLETIRFLNPAGLHTRQALFKLGIEALTRHPLIGVGIYSFEDFTGNAERLPVHNAFLQVASEIGVFGGLLFALIFPLAIYRLIRTLSRQESGAERRCVQALLLGLTVLGLHMLGEPTANHLFLWLYLGIVEGSVLLLQAGSGSWEWAVHGSRIMMPAPKEARR